MPLFDASHVRSLRREITGTMGGLSGSPPSLGRLLLASLSSRKMILVRGESFGWLLRYRRSAGPLPFTLNLTIKAVVYPTLCPRETNFRFWLIWMKRPPSRPSPFPVFMKPLLCGLRIVFPRPVIAHDAALLNAGLMSPWIVGVSFIDLAANRLHALPRRSQG